MTKPKPKQPNRLLDRNQTTTNSLANHQLAAVRGGGGVIIQGKENQP